MPSCEHTCCIQYGSKSLASHLGSTLPRDKLAYSRLPRTQRISVAESWCRLGARRLTGSMDPVRRVPNKPSSRTHDRSCVADKRRHLYTFGTCSIGGWKPFSLQTLPGSGFPGFPAKPSSKQVPILRPDCEQVSPL